MFKKTKVCTGLMLAFGGSLTLGSLPALAQDAPQRVEITGSSIKRIEGETALPVQVITRKDIEKSGAQNVEQLLQQVSAISSSGTLVASSASGATTGGISSVSLRGLTSIRTLVLLNGRRIAPYGIGFTGDSVSVDVNSIPIAAIERVEVLKDGASAVYGSDAIAGVINFILRKEYKGAEISALYGDTSGGGASTTRVSGVFGFGDLSQDRYNAMFMVSAQQEKPLFGAQRDFASKGYNDINDTTSGNTFPGNVFILEGPLAGATRNPGAPSCVGPYAVLDPNFPSNRCRFDPSPLVTLLPKTDRVSLFASGKFAITSNLEGFVEASYNRNKINTVIQPVPLSDQFAIPSNNPLFNQAPYNGNYPNDPRFNIPGFGDLRGQPTGLTAGVSAIVLSPLDPVYPTAYMQSVVGAGNPLPPIAVRYRANLSGNRNITDISSAPRLTFGVRGDTMGWDFDAAFLHSQSNVREAVNNGYPAYTAVMPLLNSGTVNLWGPNSDAITAAIQAGNFNGDAYRIKSTLDSVAAKASRELFQLPAGAMALAVGTEFRKEKYLFDPSPTIQTGDISGYGGNFLLTDKTRNVGAVFGEVNVPIVKGLEANAAVRYDHYEGVGNSTTPKISLRYQPTKELLLRGSAGKGFRAPSLQDLYLPNTQGVTPPGLNDPLRCNVPGSIPNNSNDCQTQFTVTFGGNPNLKPEKSKNYTLGIVLEPTSNFSVSVDAFKIHLTDTIVNGVTPAVILGDLTKYGALVTRGPAAGGLPGPITNIDQTNINLGETKVSGIDLDTKLSVPAGDLGKFTASLAGTYFIKYDTQNLDGTFSGGVSQVNAATGGIIPRWKHYLAVDWNRGPWTWTVAQNWQSGYWDLPGTLEDPTDPTFHQRRVGAYETYDLSTTYAGIKDLKLQAGIKNVFNKAPPYTNAGGQTSFQAGYDPQYGDPRGRFVWVGATYQFK